MRIIIYILLSWSVGIIAAKAQTSTRTEEKSSSSMSISIDGDISLSETGNTYFSTSDSNDTYKVKAKFNAAKTRRVRNYLMEELGKEGMTISGTKYYWRLDYDGATVYEIKVDEGTLRIFVDKEVASSGVFNKMKVITKNIKAYTSGKLYQNNEADKAKHEKKRLENESERKLKEAERLQRESERLLREADSLAKEAKKNQ